MLGFLRSRLPPSSFSPHRRMSTATASLIQNAHRPEGWKDAAPFPPSTSTTFAKQESLPKLPLPDFDLTIGKLKTSLKALAWSDEEFKATEKKIDDFAKDGGIGRTLQGMLKARKESEGMKHWLEEFWDNVGHCHRLQRISELKPLIY